MFVKRDFDAIFKNDALLTVYACSHLPSRMLFYRDLFHRARFFENILTKESEIYCLGAGSGSELFGLCASLVGLKNAPQVHVTLQDQSSYNCISPIFDFI